MKKSINKWIETISDENVRNLAKANYVESTNEVLILYPTLRKALKAAFRWSKSPQGKAFWRAVCDLYTALGKSKDINEESLRRIGFIDDKNWEYNLCYPVSDECQIDCYKQDGELRLMCATLSVLLHFINVNEVQQFITHFKPNYPVI